LVVLPEGWWGGGGAPAFWYVCTVSFLGAGGVLGKVLATLKTLLLIVSIAPRGGCHPPGPPQQKYKHNVINVLRTPPPFKGGVSGARKPPPEAPGAPRTEKTAQNYPKSEKKTKKLKLLKISDFLGEGFLICLKHYKDNLL